MAETKTATWKIALGYAAFSIAAFLFFFYITFPFDTIRQRLSSELASSGYDIDMKSLGPGLFGVTASDVEIRKKVVPIPGQEPKPAEPLLIDSIAFRPSIFPLGVAFRADALNGKVSGAVGGIGTLAVNVDLDDLDLSQGNLKGFSGLDLSGELDGHFSLTAPRSSSSAAPPPGQRGGAAGPGAPDFSQANGSLKLTGTGVTINGGSVPVASMGGEVDLPKVILGDLDINVPVEKGLGTIEALSAKSTDVTLNGSGTLKLAKNLDYSEPNLELRFKIEEDLKKRLGAIAFGINMLPSDPKDREFKLARVTGFLARPNFR